MPNFSQQIEGVPCNGFNNTDPTSATTAILLPLGTQVAAKDGREFRWFKNGAVDTVAGSLYQAAAQLTNHQNMAVTATSIGATVVNVTPGNTAGAANLYSEGYLIVHTTPGLGYTYAVDSHAAITASTAFNVNLRADDPVQVALTTSSKVDLIPNLYQNVIVAPTSLTGGPVGWSTYIVTASFNGWLQTWGIVGGLVNGTPAVGQMIIPSASTAGAVDIASSTGPVVGWMLVTGVSGKVQPIFSFIG